MRSQDKIRNQSKASTYNIPTVGQMWPEEAFNLACKTQNFMHLACFLKYFFGVTYPIWLAPRLFSDSSFFDGHFSDDNISDTHYLVHISDQ